MPTIPTSKAIREWREVWTVTGYGSDNSIKRTVLKGYCRADRVRQDDELYASLSTNMTSGSVTSIPDRLVVE